MAYYDDWRLGAPAELNPMPSSAYRLKTGQYSSHSLLRSRVCGGRYVCLDVGGGEGYMASLLEAAGHRVVVLAAPGTVAATMASATASIECDLDLDRPKILQRFDRIFLGDVLEHLRDPKACIDWLRLFLVPGGRFLVSVPNGVHLYVRMAVLFGHFPHDRRGICDDTHLRFYSLRGWTDLFRTCGLRLVWRTVTPVPFELVLTAMPRTAAWLEWGYLRAAKLLPGLLAYQYVFELEAPSQ